MQTPGPSDGSGGSPISPGLLERKEDEFYAASVGPNPGLRRGVCLMDLEAIGNDLDRTAEHTVYCGAVSLVSTLIPLQAGIQDQDDFGTECQGYDSVSRVVSDVVPHNQLGVVRGVGEGRQRIGFLLHGRGVAVELGEGCVDFGVVGVKISA